MMRVRVCIVAVAAAFCVTLPHVGAQSIAVTSRTALR